MGSNRDARAAHRPAAVTAGASRRPRTTSAGRKRGPDVQKRGAPAAEQSGRNAAPAARIAILPQGTPVVVSPVQEMFPKHLDTCRRVTFVAALDVVAEGTVVIPRGSPVQASVARSVGRKAEARPGRYKFSFDKVRVRGRDYALRGSHVGDASDGTMGALLDLLPAAGRRAVIAPGQLVIAFTAERIPYGA